MTKLPENDSRLSRWSRRKLQARHCIAVEDEENAQPAPPAEVAEPATQETQIDPILEENRLAAEAVDLETLDYNSDYSVFLKEGVPELLKRQALSSLWRSSPVLANVDGLVDYGDDFASPDLIMKTFDSAWKIGKGYLTESPQSDDGSSDLAPPEEMAGEEELDKASVDEAVKPEDAADAQVEDVREDDSSLDPETFAEVEIQSQDQEEGNETELVAPQKVSLRKRLMLEAE